MDIYNKFSKMSLSKLNELKSILVGICQGYADNLTDYQTMSHDVKFERMPPEVKNMYVRRGKFVNILTLINRIIEEKILSEYGVE